MCVTQISPHITNFGEEDLKAELIRRGYDPANQIIVEFLKVFKTRGVYDSYLSQKNYVSQTYDTSKKIPRYYHLALPKDKIRGGSIFITSDGLENSVNLLTGRLPLVELVPLLLNMPPEERHLYFRKAKLSGALKLDDLIHLKITFTPSQKPKN